MLVKTTAAQAEACRAAIVAAHPYDCPEVVAVRADKLGTHEPYSAWATQATHNVGEDVDTRGRA